MMKSISVSVSAFALVAFLGGSAQAATLSAEELLSQFNLITVGDVTGTSGSHVHGRALVGGNWSGGSEVYTHGDGAPSGYAALTVGGNVTSPVKVLGGGNAAINGTGAGNVIFGGGSLLPYTAPDGFTSVLTGYSNALAGMPSNASAFVNNQNLTLSGSGITGTAVFSLTENDINVQSQGFAFDLGSADNIVVNVTATQNDKDFDLAGAHNFTGDTSASGSIIWNFIGFENVSFYARFMGNILAPDAKVSNYSGDLVGSVFADSYYASSQLHYTTPNVPTSVPLPAGLPLLLGGMGLLGLLRRKR